MLGRLKKKKKKRKKKIERFFHFPYITLAMAICECYWVHSDSYTMVRYLKRLKSSKFVRVKAFPMYGGIGVSAPSLHT